MNKAKKKEYKVEKLSSTTPFGSLDSILSAIQEVDDRVGGNIGYIEPGHGLKGKQKWLLDDNDVSEMYAVHKNKREVMLYAFTDRQVEGGSGRVAPTQSHSRKHTEQSTDAQTTKKDGYAKTITEVETVMSKLKEKHGARYDAERYACWAHTIHSGKHSSYEQPPDLPYFTRRKKISREDGPSTSSGSPTKRLCHRTTCIDQLGKWHDLLQSGAISQDQYDEMKDSILKDIKALN